MASQPHTTTTANAIRAVRDGLQNGTISVFEAWVSLPTSLQEEITPALSSCFIHNDTGKAEQILADHFKTLQYEYLDVPQRGRVETQVPFIDVRDEHSLELEQNNAITISQERLQAHVKSLEKLRETLGKGPSRVAYTQPKKRIEDIVGKWIQTEGARSKLQRIQESGLELPEGELRRFLQQEGVPPLYHEAIVQELGARRKQAETVSAEMVGAIAKHEGAPETADGYFSDFFRHPPKTVAKKDLWMIVDKSIVFTVSKSALSPDEQKVVQAKADGYFGSIKFYQDFQKAYEKHGKGVSREAYALMVVRDRVREIGERMEREGVSIGGAVVDSPLFKEISEKTDRTVTSNSAQSVGGDIFTSIFGDSSPIDPEIAQTLQHPQPAGQNLPQLTSRVWSSSIQAVQTGKDIKDIITTIRAAAGIEPVASAGLALASEGAAIGVGTAAKGAIASAVGISGGPVTLGLAALTIFGEKFKETLVSLSQGSLPKEMKFFGISVVEIGIIIVLLPLIIVAIPFSIPFIGDLFTGSNKMLVLNNTAMIKGLITEGDLEKNPADEYVSILKTASPSTFENSSSPKNVTYTVTVSVVGGQPITNMTIVSDTLKDTSGKTYETSIDKAAFSDGGGSSSYSVSIPGTVKDAVLINTVVVSFTSPDNQTLTQQGTSIITIGTPPVPKCINFGKAGQPPNGCGIATNGQNTSEWSGKPYSDAMNAITLITSYKGMAAYICAPGTSALTLYYVNTSPNGHFGCINGGNMYFNNGAFGPTAFILAHEFAHRISDMNNFESLFKKCVFRKEPPTDYAIREGGSNENVVLSEDFADSIGLFVNDYINALGSRPLHKKFAEYVLTGTVNGSPVGGNSNGSCPF